MATEVLIKRYRTIAGNYHQQQQQGFGCGDVIVCLLIIYAPFEKQKEGPLPSDNNKGNSEKKKKSWRRKAAKKVKVGSISYVKNGIRLGQAFGIFISSTSTAPFILYPIIALKYAEFTLNFGTTLFTFSLDNTIPFEKVNIPTQSTLLQCKRNKTWTHGIDRRTKQRLSRTNTSMLYHIHSTSSTPYPFFFFPNVFSPHRRRLLYQTKNKI
mmetsp:Transcript_5749/g.8452  ORF Transcript_5749/g.8452 Transcript_5749/m.8452 type:complete len:211 (+) Transcript_5749:304-936(+)